MHLMQKSVFVLCCVFLVGESLGGTIPTSLDEYHHRTTSLDELKEIDSYVATGLPLFDHGFFVSTAQGPILVKQKEEGTKQNKPRLNPGYYSQLPRLVPSGGIGPLGLIPPGYEGLSISHFNLGSAIPAHSPTYYTHHPSSQIYHDPQQQQQFASQFTPQVQSHGYNYAPPPPSSELTSHPPQQHQQHHFVPSDSQSPILQTTQSRHFIQHYPRRRQDRGFIDHHHQQQRQSPVAQSTFQINNYLNAEDQEEDEHVPTSYQNTMISHEPFGSRKLTKNPTVEQAFGFEDTLPEEFKNKFYKNQALASVLSKESLPVHGETIVGEWDTSKIQKKRISDLLNQLI